MVQTTLDTLARRLAASPSRRSLMRGFFAAVVGFGAARVVAEPAAAQSCNELGTSCDVNDGNDGSCCDPEMICSAGWCFWAEGAGCTYSSECETGFCSDENGQECDSGSAYCSCSWGSEPECQLDDDCVDGMICVDYLCVPGTGTLTIHKADCPSDVENLYNSCHDRNLAGIDFVFYNGIDTATVSPYETTDESGHIYIQIVGGTVEIEEDPSQIDVGCYIYCKDLVTEDVLFDGRADDGYISFEAADDMAIVCDWYNLIAPENDSVGGGDPEDPGNWELPDTGKSSGNASATVLISTAVAAGAAFIAGKRLRAGESG